MCCCYLFCCCKPWEPGDYLKKTDQTNYIGHIERGFFRLSRINDSLHEDKTLPINTGWKIHVSFDAKEEFDYRKAWRLTGAIIEEYKLNYAKVVTRENRGQLINKQITLYHFRENIMPEKWHELLQKIETQLSSLDIPSPKNFPQADQQISGSQYLSYRNDHPEPPKTNNKKSRLTRQVNPLKAEQAITIASRDETQSFNPYHHPNPFADLQINLNRETLISTV